MDLVIQFRGTVYENGYGQIAKKVMRDKRLHTTAKAIYAYLCSFAGGGVEEDKYAFPSVALMMDELNIKSEDTFYKHRKQLIDFGYLSMEQKRDSKGQFIRNLYIIESVPHPKNQSTDEPYPKFSGPEKNGDRKNWGTNNNSLLNKNRSLNNESNIEFKPYNWLEPEKN